MLVVGRRLLAVVRRLNAVPALRGAQTMRAGCSKAEPKIFARSSSPFPGARDGKNLTDLYLQTHFGEYRCTQFLVIVVTDLQRPPARARPCTTDRDDYNTLRRSLARSVIRGWY